ncbi:MAG: DNA repair protein RecO [Desulfovibrio sp.]|nr:DNA repair protein RecO [Desulfovibrio sp.]
MREWTDVAFVLRTGYFREIDIWLKVLAPTHGLFTCFAFGGAKSRHRFCGCLEMLNTIRGHFCVNAKKMCTLKEAVLVDGTRGVRGNIRRMGLAANCLRFVEACGVDSETANDFFLLLEDVRSSLEEKRLLPELFPLFFRLHAARILGYAPDFSQCGLCGKTLDEKYAFFQVDEGLMLCEACQKKERADRRFQTLLSHNERHLLANILSSYPSSWRDDSLTAQEKRDCSQAIDGFIQYHLGIVWERGSFRKR